MKNQILYLHVGAPKTGTSSIQSFLTLNHEILREKGVLYPYPQTFFQSFQTSSGNGNFLCRTDSEYDKSISDRRLEKLAMYDLKILLSTERLFIEERETFEEISQIFNHVKVIFYVRRQDNLIQSGMLQDIKNSKLTSIYPSDYEAPAYLPYLECLSAIFGKKNIIVQPYEKQQFSGDNIYADFLQKIGLSLTDEYQMPVKNVNPSFNLKYAQLKGILNSLPFGEQILRETFVEALWELSAQEESREPFSDIKLFPPAQRLEIIRKCEKDNVKIATEFLSRNDGKLFYDPLPDINEKWEPVDQLSLETVVKSFGYLFVQQQLQWDENSKAIEESSSIQLEQKLSATLGEVRGLKQRLNGLDQTIKLQNETLRSNEKQLAIIRSSKIWRLNKLFNVFSLKKIKLKLAERSLLKRVIKSGFFDEAYYLENNPDLISSGINPLKHFLLYGGLEGRNPGKNFDSMFYLDTYPDVRKAKLNPLIHYLDHGIYENRKILPKGIYRRFFNRESFLLQKLKTLQYFLNSGAQINLACEKPEISIILVLYNKAELSLACLQSIVKYADVPYEVIIVDNNSIDETVSLLDCVKGAKIIRNKKNLHFLEGCNQALEHVCGSKVLLLNNDAELMENSLSSAYNVFQEVPACGAVGAKIILPDNTLQEAGSIIWRDGSCLGYGRGESSLAPEYNFRRIVDYCSGAFLLTKTSLFREHRGFDARFKPAYYEETDYCLWLQEQGKHVVYNPETVIRHFEFGSAGQGNAVRIQQENRKKFVEKHKLQLSLHFASLPSNVLKGRFAASQARKKKILYIDDRIPHSNNGAGYPRSNKIIRLLVELGYQLTIFPNMFPDEENWTEAYRDIDPSVEIVTGIGVEGFSSFIEERNEYYDFVWVSRPHNMQKLIQHLEGYRKSFKIIYDAEAIYAERDLLKSKLDGDDLEKDNINELINAELELCKQADIILAVSEIDAKKIKICGVDNVMVLGHALDVKSSKKSFGDRRGLLFVGNLNDEDSPNVDSVLWFVNEILPLVRQQIPGIELHIVGSSQADSIKAIRSDGVTVHGRVDDLSDFYNTCRVFVAPTRFAAGIPYKIHEAASFGLPVVATRLLANQLDWKHKEHLLAAEANANDFVDQLINLHENSNLWESVQNNAYKIIEAEFSTAAYKITLDSIFN